MDIILYLLSLCQQLYQQNRMLLGLLCRYVPLRQWAFDDSHSPKYEKFKTDELPKIIPIPHKDWKNLKREYQRTHDGKILAPVRRRKGNTIPDDTRCPCCNAPADYIYRNLSFFCRKKPFPQGLRITLPLLFTLAGIHQGPERVPHLEMRQPQLLLLPEQPEESGSGLSKRKKRL